MGTQSPSSPPSREGAQAEANKAVVRSFYEEVVNGGDLRAVDDLIQPRFGAPEVIAQRVAVLRTALPDGRRTIDDFVAEEDRVVVRYTDRGTHRGPFFGVPATDKPVEYGGMWILRLAEGKIVEGWHTMDTLGLLEQLGASVTLPPRSQAPQAPQAIGGAGSPTPVPGTRGRTAAHLGDQGWPVALGALAGPRGLGREEAAGRCGRDGGSPHQRAEK